jgi:hypothetical protein
MDSQRLKALPQRNWRLIIMENDGLPHLVIQVHGGADKANEGSIGPDEQVFRIVPSPLVSTDMGRERVWGNVIVSMKVMISKEDSLIATSCKMLANLWSESGL